MKLPISPHIEAKLTKSLSYIRLKTHYKPQIGIVLGSGLGEFAERLLKPNVIETRSIPNYPASSVEGHSGKLYFGRSHTKTVLAFQGRVHFYETGKLESIIYPILVASKLGIKILIVTNAAGGINRHFQPGDLMMIRDQINLTFENPLHIFQPDCQKRFSARLPQACGGQAGKPHSTFDYPHNKFNTPDLYDKKLQRIIETISRKKHIPIRSGVYCGVKGPSYETAAEIEMIRHIGGDAVGMSTVNEVSVAHALGLKIAGISCITNLSTGISSTPLSHDEVTEVANQVKVKFIKLIENIIGSL